MKYRRLVTLGVAVAAMIAAAPTPVHADPHDDQIRVDRALASTQAAMETATDRVAAAAAALEQVEARLPEVQRRLAEARGVLAGAQVHARAMARAADAAAQAAAQAGADLQGAEATVDEARAHLSAFSANSYRGVGLTGMDGMLAVHTPAEFATGLGYLQQIAARQREAVAQVTAARLVAKQAQNASLRAQRVADQARQTADAAVQQAAAAESSAARSEQEVTDLQARRTTALAVASEEKDATLARYRELQAESARIAEEIRALARRGGQPVVTGPARLPMPVRGWKSSDFGMRFDPFYHVWQLHAGVDLAAAGGSPIWAVAPGRVIRAGWNGGYGNYTCLYHGLYQGRGFATCYAHQSWIGVSPGQQVSRGQVIGRVGTTGASTGYHLHFEVRLDGEPVDPVPWLPPCLC